jgi:uncharacterized protein YidB (DUF937 family)
LGEDNIRALVEQAGMPWEQLLSSLSEDLPGSGDQLTPPKAAPQERTKPGSGMRTMEKVI